MITAVQQQQYSSQTIAVLPLVRYGSFGEDAHWYWFTTVYSDFLCMNEYELLLQQ